jgi:hypothetical protein
MGFSAIGQANLNGWSQTPTKKNYVDRTLPMEKDLNEHGKLICLVAAIIVAGERANPTMVNPGNSYEETETDQRGMAG